MARSKRTFFGDFRTFFVRGLAILLPSIITIGLLAWALNFLYVRIAGPINAGVRYVVVDFGDDITHVFGGRMPAWYEVSDAQIEARRSRSGGLEDRSDAWVRRELREEELRKVWNRHWYLSAFGFVIAITGVYLAGVFFGNFVGRRVYERLERAFVRLPLIKQVYPNVKQITDFMVGGEQDAKAKMPGSKVVLVEYPRKGIWTIGLLTGNSMDLVEKAAGDRHLVTIFIPSSPTPFTGYTINVPVEDVFEVSITLDEAIRFVVSGGVLVPPARLPERFRAGADAEDEIRRIALPGEGEGEGESDGAGASSRGH